VEQILAGIVSDVRDDLEARKRALPEEELEQLAREAPPRPSLREALSETPAPRIIAEIKRRSPSAGDLRHDVSPPELARAYAGAGAAAISVLTEPRHFGGSLADLAAVAQAVDVPLLRKDFVVERYQLLEARAAGASAALLIASVLDDAQLGALLAAAREIGLETLVEVHDQREAERLILHAHLLDAVGVNNRDLHTMRVSLETSRRLAPALPPHVPHVSESGVSRPADIAGLEPFGYHAFLVGGALMRADDPAAMLRWLRTDVTELHSGEDAGGLPA
jgi:indole-3-glycerol phosphate synthase